MTDEERRESQDKREAGDPAGFVKGLRDRLQGVDIGQLGSRYGRHLAIIVVLLLGLWAARMGLDSLPITALTGNGQETEVAATPTALPNPLTVADLPSYGSDQTVSFGIQRKLDIHTVIPSRPRLEVDTYEVKKGDSLFGIADQFGLKPETILWGNHEVLEDNPHALEPGQELNILPVDGTYYQWHEGDTLTGVANFFQVEPEDIIDWPTNDLNPAMDYRNPDIEAGTWLIVPGGKREFVSWQAPRVTRDNPAAARVVGPGFCGQIVDGAIGTGTFAWPTPGTSLSGFNYSSYHPAIDIGGAIGHAIYASDTGVVVYAGWNNYGYGNLVILDHGNGWQSLYAHLDRVDVGCGESVFQSSQLGTMGVSGNSSGPHLHFELQSDVYGKVNPANFLP